MDTIAAFDIGSTNLRYVLGDPERGFLTEPRTVPSRPERLGEQVVEATRSLDAEATEPLSAVCVATTGLVDHDAGAVRFDSSRAGDHVRVPLAREVDAELGLPTVVENDCSAAALGEVAFGRGGEYDSVVYVTVGSGIGAGVYERGTLLRGESGQAGEVGVLPILAEGHRSSTGVRGAWEAYCSGQGIPGFVSDLLEGETRETVLADADELTARDVFEAAADGDAVAASYLDRVGRLNAAGIGALSNAYNPGLLTVGGGVALSNPERTLRPIRDHLDEYLLVERPEVALTPLGDLVGLYGAVALYSQVERR